ncbi:MAG: 2-succinyl-5-enolpyruvyl-6-hydroxy-3-cyclohexene-1-carboxylic-acid synthase [Microscillaceae bacterium]
MDYGLLLSLVQTCWQQNLRHVVLSPGSRVAPLALGFIRHPFIETSTRSDERAAAYTALGRALQALSDYHKGPNTEALPLVGLACTSGTAALNYAPAVAEAFFQQIPLVVFTADRPPEWIGQADNQAIRQDNLYGPHVKGFFLMPTDTLNPDAKWQAERMLNEALLLAATPPFGPVHLNVPFREPFYPAPGQAWSYPPKARLHRRPATQTILAKPAWAELMNEWEDSERKLIVAGQNFYQPSLSQALQHLQEDYKIPVMGDITANLSTLIGPLIQHQDIFLSQQNPDLQPDLLITFGQALLSKALKGFLRQARPRQHWHVQAAAPIPDPLQSLTHWIPMEPAVFFSQLYQDLDFKNLLQEGDDENAPFFKVWQEANREAAKFLQRYSFADDDFSELRLVGAILEKLPPGSLLHLANSMPVRYANLWGLKPANPSSTPTEVFANRGTSGIDGCLSTAVGAALAAPSRLVVLLTGDLAFFYDRNGLWHNENCPNLRIILLNNHGGNIFRMIDGPAHQPELEVYFETQQKLQAENTARDFDLEYHKAQSWPEMQAILATFFEPSARPKILELETDRYANAQQWKAFKQAYRQTFGFQ